MRDVATITVTVTTCGENGGRCPNGLPCKRIPRKGKTRCYIHSFEVAGPLYKAEKAMALARVPAVEALHSLIDQFYEHVCGSCGYPSGSVKEKRMIIDACKAVLDRSGLGPRSTLVLTPQSDGDLDLRQLTDEERAELVGLLARVKEIKDQVRARAIAMLPAEAETPDPHETVVH